MHWLMGVVGVCSGMCVWDARTAFTPRGATCARSRVCVSAMREPVWFFALPRRPSSDACSLALRYGDVWWTVVLATAVCVSVCAHVAPSLPLAPSRRKSGVGCGVDFADCLATHACVCRRCVGDVGQVMWMHWLMVVVGLCSGMYVWDARTAFNPPGATFAQSRVCGVRCVSLCFLLLFVLSR